MNYAVIKKTDIANGPGVRVSLFVSGCTHACKGCFNEEAWDFGFGSAFTDETVSEVLKALEPDYISGLSMLGGEPLDPRNRGAVRGLLESVRERYPHKTIWCYTGYRYEDIIRWQMEGDEDIPAILSRLDVLVDGPFIEAKKDLNLLFRGSSNQRLIDVRETARCGRLVEWSRDKTG